MGDLDFLHGGDVYEAERKYKKKVTDFSANINPLGLSAAVRKAVRNNLDKILYYPDREAGRVRQKIAKYWRINEENILLGNGSVELIYLITSALKPKSVIIPSPTFSEYERAAKNAGSKIQFLALREKEGYSLDLSRAEETDILFLCNPNNPTGNLILKDGEKFEKKVNKLALVDEAFMDFLPNQKNHTLIGKAARSRKIAVLRTLTKFFALPGLRIGYVIAHKEIINKLKQHQPPWSTNSLAQFSAEASINDKAYIEKTYHLIEKERNYLFAELSGIKSLKPYPSAANFILIKIEKSTLTSVFLRRLLIRKGILVRDCSNFRNLSNKYIRIAVRSRKENLKLLAALREVL